MITKTASKMSFDFFEVRKYTIKSSEQLLFSVYMVHDKKFNVKKFNQ